MNGQRENGDRIDGANCFHRLVTLEIAALFIRIAPFSFTAEMISAYRHLRTAAATAAAYLKRSSSSSALL
jgi:hypothetical protein